MVAIVVVGGECVDLNEFDEADLFKVPLSVLFLPVALSCCCCCGFEVSY